MPILICVLLLALSGCGGGDDTSADPSKPSGSPDPEAKVAAQRYLDAYKNKDAAAICDTLAKDLRDQLADDKGTCVKTIKASLKGVKFEKLTVTKALSDGDVAHATIEGSARQVTLEKDGSEWKVVNGGV